jgi:mRNA-degrading endonuclease RelE of RelBE toxin-antitoxin system
VRGYRVVFSRNAQRDAKKLAKSNLKQSAQGLIEILKEDPLTIRHLLNASRETCRAFI